MNSADSAAIAFGALAVRAREGCRPLEKMARIFGESEDRVERARVRRWKERGYCPTCGGFLAAGSPDTEGTQ